MLHLMFSTNVCLQLLDKERQLKLLHCTVKNSLAVAYPPSLSYSRAFLKSLITQVSFSLFVLFVGRNFFTVLSQMSLDALLLTMHVHV